MNEPVASYAHRLAAERPCNMSWSALSFEDFCGHACGLPMDHLGDHECAHYLLPRASDHGLIKKERPS